jgi:hypothetical protein
MDIFAFCETWCESLPTWCTSLHDYQVLSLPAYRNYSRGRAMRGLCVFVKKHLRVSGIV